MRKIWGHLLFPSNPHVSRIGGARPKRRADISTVAASHSRNIRAKFKFKFVLTTVNHCAFCLFRFCKTVFNFKFKLILRKKKIYVNSFLTNFQLPMLVEPIILKNPPFTKGGKFFDSTKSPPFLKGDLGRF
jgi:hypothetical protein